jgi:putative tryptophan/tyrosine transport system substrate-binding protein
MNRRELIALLGGATVASPLTARAQQGKPTIGFLGTASAAMWSPWSAAFSQRLRELGWMDGRNLNIEYRWAEGRAERINEIAAELVRLKVDVIVTSGTGVAAAKQASAATPIVFAVAVDALGSGFASSLSRPGGNVTGLSIQSRDLTGKRLELLREISPALRHLGILANGAYPAAVSEMDDVAVAAGSLGLESVPVKVRHADEFAGAFEGLKGRADALYVVGESFFNANRMRITGLALSTRLPTICPFREFAEAGALVSYGASYPQMFRRAAELVDRILRGAKPADLPVEQPTKFDLVINLLTAKALGLNVPATLLALADEVIE